MTEPTTQAGRALLEEYEPEFSDNPDRDVLAERIAAIEAEAVKDWLASPDAERRLAAAHHAHTHTNQQPSDLNHCPSKDWHLYEVRAILAALREP